LHAWIESAVLELQKYVRVWCEQRNIAGEGHRKPLIFLSIGRKQKISGLPLRL